MKNPKQTISQTLINLNSQGKNKKARKMADNYLNKQNPVKPKK